MEDIVEALMVDLKEHLEDKMIDSIPAAYASELEYVDKDGTTRTLTPSEVHVGRVFDPTEYQDSNIAIPLILVNIHPHDPSDLGDGWEHTIGSSVSSSATNAGVSFGPVHEIGGGTHWWRRFVVHFRVWCFDSDQTQDDARKFAGMIRALLEKYIDSYRSGNTHGWACGTVTDMFSEVAQQSVVTKSHIWEGGGPDDDFLWEGQVWFQVKTYRE